MLSNPLKFGRNQGAELLKFHLEDFHKMCRSPSHPLAPKGRTLWPSRRGLDELEDVIRLLAALYDGGRGSTWSRILAIEKNRPALHLRKRIKELVDRAVGLCGELPRALEIARQARGGSVAAKACLKDLQKCIDGQAGLMSVE